LQKPNGNRIKLEHDMRQVNPITEKELGQNCYDTEIILRLRNGKKVVREANQVISQGLKALSSVPAKRKQQKS
jgi:hypothetical protein